MPKKFWDYFEDARYRFRDEYEKELEENGDGIQLSEATNSSVDDCGDEYFCAPPVIYEDDT